MYSDVILWFFWFAFELFVAICLIRVGPPRYGFRSHVLLLGSVLAGIRLACLWFLLYRAWTNRFGSPELYGSALLLPESRIFGSGATSISNALLLSVFLAIGSFVLAVILTITERAISLLERKLGLLKPSNGKHLIM